MISQTTDNAFTAVTLSVWSYSWLLKNPRQQSPKVALDIIINYYQLSPVKLPENVCIMCDAGNWYWRWTGGIKRATPLLSTTGGRWRKDEARPLVGRSAFVVFHPVLWHCWLHDRKDIHPIKPVPFIPKGSLPQQVEEETWGEPINAGSSGKWLWKRRITWYWQQMHVMTRCFYTHDYNHVRVSRYYSIM